MKSPFRVKHYLYMGALFLVLFAKQSTGLFEPPRQLLLMTFAIKSSGCLALPGSANGGLL